MENNCAVQIAVRERGGSFDKPENRIVSYYDESEHIISIEERAFSFDYVLGPHVSQKELFEKLIRPLMVKVRRGYNCTALAYGQTGAGKTYTIGLDTTTFDGEDAGMIPRVLHEFFSEHAQPEKTALDTSSQIQVSFVEIYNEKVYDLLGTDAKEQILPKGWKNYAGTLREITSIDDCRSILMEGSKNRHVRPTVLNSQSSRSHAIFSIHYTQRTNAKSITSYFNLVDLAGSEGVRRTGNEGMAKAEGVNINQGLLGIGKVLQAMASGNKVVPYRDSVLSLVLQDSLSPNSYLTLLACISPYRENLHATLSTLRFAQNAKLVKHTPQMNAVLNEIRRNVGRATLYKVQTASSTKKVVPLALVGQRSAVKRAALQHGNTFCTPNKQQKMSTHKLSQSGIGLTPRAKEKARQKMANVIRSTQRSSANVRLEFMPNPENRLNHSNESMCSSLLSFNLSSSTQVESNEPPPTLLPPVPAQNFSPVIRKYMSEMEQRIESKLQSLTDVLINRIGGTNPNDATRSTKPQEVTQVNHADVTSIRQEFVDELKDMVEKMQSKTVEDQSNAGLPLVTSSTEIVPKQLFVTSSPIFKEPELPTARRTRKRLPTITDITSTQCCDEPSIVTRQRARLHFTSTLNGGSMELSGIENTTLLEDFMSHSKRRQSTRVLMRRIRETSQTKVEPSDGSNVAVVVTKKAKSRESTAPNLLAVGNGRSQLTKYRKQMLELLNNGTLKELRKLPQIGEKMAYQLVLQRTLHGKLNTLKEVEKLPIWRGNSWERFSKANCLV